MISTLYIFNRFTKENEGNFIPATKISNIRINKCNIIIFYLFFYFLCHLFLLFINLSLSISCYNYWCLKSPILREVMILYRGASIKSSFAGLIQKLVIVLMANYVCLPTEFHSYLCISQFSNQKSVVIITLKGTAGLENAAILDTKKKPIQGRRKTFTNFIEFLIPTPI